MDIAKIAAAGLLATAAFAFARPSIAQDSPPASSARAKLGTASIPSAPAASVRIVENDVPPPPSAPDVPPAPPAPPGAAVPPTSSEPHYAIDMHGDLGQTMHAMIRQMTPEERRKLHSIVHNLHHQIHDAMVKARPELQHAMAELQAHRAELETLRPQIEQAMRDAEPQIEQAIEQARKAGVDAHLDERVQRHIEKAMRQMEKMHLEAQHDRHGHSMPDMDDESSDGNAPDDSR